MPASGNLILDAALQTVLKSFKSFSSSYPPPIDPPNAHIPEYANNAS
jgi:hypothetical protein